MEELNEINVFDAFYEELGDLTPGRILLAEHLGSVLTEREIENGSSFTEAMGTKLAERLGVVWHRRVAPSVAFGLRVALPPDQMKTVMNRLLFDSSCYDSDGFVYQRVLHHLPGLPGNFGAPAPVWSVKLGEDFVPYDQPEQEALEAAHQSGVQHCDITVRGVEYVVDISFGLQKMTQWAKGFGFERGWAGGWQCPKADNTRALPVKRAGGPVEITPSYRNKQELDLIAEPPVVPKAAPPAELKATESVASPTTSPRCKKRRTDETDDGASDGSNNVFFHRDALGKTCFSAEEASEACERLVDMQLVERVKKCLQRKQWVLPQQSNDMGNFFCNESVYGTLNVLCVTGVVRLAYPEETEEDRQFEAHYERFEAARQTAIDGGASPSEAHSIAAKQEEWPPKAILEIAESGPKKKEEDPFDAWPPEEVRNDKLHVMYEGKEFHDGLTNGEYVEGFGYTWHWTPADDKNEAENDGDKGCELLGVTDRF